MLLPVLAAAVVCLLLTVVTTIVAVTRICWDPAPATSRPRRSRRQLIKPQLRMAPQRLFAVFVLRRPLTEDKAEYALRHEADAADASMPETPETVTALPQREKRICPAHGESRHRAGLRQRRRPGDTTT